MNKRQRKKHRTGEYTEHGFLLRFSLPPSWTEAEADRFLDEFITMVEREGLAFGGSGRLDWEGFVVPDRRGTVTTEQRARVEAWLAGRPEVSALRVGPLIDAWQELPFEYARGAGSASGFPIPAHSR